MQERNLKANEGSTSRVRITSTNRIDDAFKKGTHNTCIENFFSAIVGYK